jgi:hypothetical protein
MTEFRMPNGDRAWADDRTAPTRFVAQRAENRFQAYQLLEGQFLSVGYVMARNDVRPFLQGFQIDLMSEFGENTELEPVVYKTTPFS